MGPSLKDAWVSAEAWEWSTGPASPFCCLDSLAALSCQSGRETTRQDQRSDVMRRWGAPWLLSAQMEPDRGHCTSSLGSGRFVGDVIPLAWHWISGHAADGRSTLYVILYKTHTCAIRDNRPSGGTVWVPQAREREPVPVTLPFLLSEKHFSWVWWLQKNKRLLFASCRSASHNTQLTACRVLIPGQENGSV